jgi:hypothetical protein
MWAQEVITRSALKVALILGPLSVLAAVGAHQALASWVWQRLDLRQAGPTALPAGLTSLSAESCRPCHPTQYEGWSGSAMGRAMTDPVFLADFHAQDDLSLCLFCHAPLLEQQPTLVTGLASLKPLRAREQPNPRFDPALQREGVTCVACHLVDGVLVGPDGDPAPHPTRRDPRFREAERCVRCHQVPEPPLSNLDRPLADTHGEWEAWKAQTGRTETCTDCHMPARAHGWPGAFDAQLLQSGLGVTVTADEHRVQVTLENRAGHRFPSADPARALVVRAGREEAVLARRVPLPRLRDEGDNTLLPAEVRTIELPRDPDAREVQVVMQPVRLLHVEVEAVEIEIARIALP